MVSNVPSTFVRSCLIVALALLPAAGCGHQSANQAIDQALKGKSRDKVCPLAGTVRIDGVAPKLASNQKLIVMLNDTSKPEVPVAARPFTAANADGQFEFTSYAPGDGVAAGHYVVTFAVFTRHGKKGLEGPDEFKNLYNDPDKNASVPALVIDHNAPGKRDYAFDLQIVGKAAATPGAHALVTLKDPYFKSR